MEGEKRFTKCLFLFLSLFVPALTIDSRSVNLALETSFLFDPQDIKENATFISKVQSVIDKLKKALKPTPGPIFRQKLEETDAVLTKFISDIAGSILKFDDADISKFVDDLSAVVQKQANESKVFNKMIEDPSLKVFIVKTVSRWADMEAKKLKQMIANFLTSTESSSLIKLVQMLGKFFDSTDEPKFNRLRKKFESAKKTAEFEKFLTKTIDYVVFRTFSKLNTLMQQIFKQEIKKFVSFMKKKLIEDNGKDSSLEVGNRRMALSGIARSQTFSESSRQEFDTSDSFEKTSTSNTEKTPLVFNEDLQMDVRKDDAVVN